MNIKQRSPLSALEDKLRRMEIKASRVKTRQKERDVSVREKPSNRSYSQPRTDEQMPAPAVKKHGLATLDISCSVSSRGVVERIMPGKGRAPKI